MDKFLDEEDLPQFYELLNKAQKRSTQINKNQQKIDLFIVLDISGSMNETSNKIMNYGAGIVSFFGTFGFGALIKLQQRLMNALTDQQQIPITWQQLFDKHHQYAQILTQLFNTRLQQAKKHLIFQIQDLYKKKRINKIGLITFNHNAKIAVQLTSDIDKVISYIIDQKAHGATALYDSLEYAIQQLKYSSNPRLLIMTDGQDNSSKTQKFQWSQKWFKKDGLKSTFFTICQGDNQKNRNLAQTLNSKYVAAEAQTWYSNSFDEQRIKEGFINLI